MQQVNTGFYMGLLSVIRILTMFFGWMSYNNYSLDSLKNSWTDPMELLFFGPLISDIVNMVITLIEVVIESHTIEGYVWDFIGAFLPYIIVINEFIGNLPSVIVNALAVFIASVFILTWTGSSDKISFFVDLLNTHWSQAKMTIELTFATDVFWIVEACILYPWLTELLRYSSSSFSLSYI